MIHKACTYTWLLLMLLATSASAQTQSEKLSVFIEISHFTDSSVSFSWDSPNRTFTNISRKTIAEIDWTPLVSNYTESTYTDTTSTNIEYEYKFQVANSENANNAYGYIAFGTNIAAKTSRGNLLLVIDDRFATTLATEIVQLQQDAIADGYNPALLYVNQDENVTSVKAKIDAQHATSTLSGIYLIGHVPVPKSGIITPDGHGDHRGAWAADLYYVSTSAHWTDSTTNYTNTQDTTMSNVPGDGKFDNSRLTEETLCPISRVDFYNLPSQANSELQMLKNYLNEASKYKHGKVEVKEAGLIDNKLVNFSEGFAGNGYRNFKSLMGDSITTGAMLSNLEQDTYKWMYAVSYGADTQMFNIASVNDLKNSNYKGIFSMVMGSYFGDWDKQDNFMRSLLADGKMLTTCWAGRPNWFFHHMGLNNPIGLSAKMTAENDAGWSPLNASKYDVAGIGQNLIHISLLGDLTLRQNHLPSINYFSAKYKASDSTTELTWEQPSASTSASIEIYKSSDSTSGYTLLATIAYSDTLFVDSNITQPYYYYIKYITLDTTLSGTYYNNSLGLFLRVDTASNEESIFISTVPAELISFAAHKLGNDGILKWTTATEKNVSHFSIQRSYDLQNWETIGTQGAAGNSVTNKNYHYTDYNLAAGLSYYRLQTIDYDGYTETSKTEVLKNNDLHVTIFPNPSSTSNLQFAVGREITDAEYSSIEIIDMRGNAIPFLVDKYSNKLTLDARKGVYFIKILDQAQRVILL